MYSLINGTYIIILDIKIKSQGGPYPLKIKLEGGKLYTNTPPHIYICLIFNFQKKTSNCVKRT